MFSYKEWREQRSEFEQEFFDFIVETHKKFEEQKKVIYAEIKKLEEMSNESGIPIDMTISGDILTFVPENIHPKLEFKSIDHPYVQLIVEKREQEEDFIKNTHNSWHFYQDHEELWVSSYSE